MNNEPPAYRTINCVLGCAPPHHGEGCPWVGFALAPRQRYRLRNGEIGTEYAAVLEVIQHLRVKQQQLADRIEELQRQLDVAEGHP